MLWYTTESGKYKIESLSAATFPGALRVIRDTFFQDEPVCVGTEVNKDPQAVEELLELCADAALDGVSLVAVETKTGEVASVIFNKLQIPSNSTEKMFFETFVEERCTRPASCALMQYMIDVDAKCNLFEKYRADCSFEMMFLGTLREHRRTKLGFILLNLSLSLAKKLGNGPVSKFTLKNLGPKYSYLKERAVTKKVPKICQAICTVEATRKILKNLGFNVELKIFMKQHTYNGKTYADRLGDQAAYAEVLALVLENHTEQQDYIPKSKI